jgi:transcriptional regulator with XRE-family HTH domain
MANESKPREESLLVIASLKPAKSVDSLRDQLMEQAQRFEMGARIKALRERSPWTQPEVAEKLGLGLRGYQEIEVRGTTKWDHVRRLAEIHDADAGWIWEGDPVSSDEPPLLAEILARQNELLVAVAEGRSALEARLSRIERAARSRASRES